MKIFPGQYWALPVRAKKEDRSIICCGVIKRDKWSSFATANLSLGVPLALPVRVKKADRPNGPPYEPIWSSEPRIGNGRTCDGVSEAHSPMVGRVAASEITTMGGIRQRTTNRSGVKGMTPLRKARQAVWIGSLDCQYIKTTQPRIDTTLSRPAKKTHAANRIMDFSPCLPPLIFS
jgi:hypothetical protein